MGNMKKRLNRLLHSDRQKPSIAAPGKDPQTEIHLSEALNENLKLLQTVYADCSDVILHQFLIGEQTKALLAYIDGLVNLEEADQHVLAPLQQNIDAEHTLPNIRKKVAVSSIKDVRTVADIIAEVSGGNPVLLMDGQNQGLAFALSKFEKRGIEEPISESVLRGPREGFVETLRTNTSMLRRKFRSPNLKIKSMNIGIYSRTPIAIVYIEGVADPGLIQEMTSRLQRIEVDGILGSAAVEELIEDNPYSPFPQLLSTERPDVASSYLLEGHVVVLVDGTPSALIAPVTIVSLLQSPDDYSERYFVGSAIRWLRYLFLFVSLLGPSFYVAAITFHQEMLPTALLLTMAKSREQVPFPALIEALIMETVFEALREAGARLPKQIGQAVSIVGALVIGQAAIAAGIASAPMVLAVAVTGVASFMAPRFTVGIAMRLLRYPMMFLAGFLGLLGLILGVIVILYHLLTLRSFGVPYMSPLAPLKRNDLKDVLWRAPRWKMNTRPHLTGEWNQYRQAPGQQPHPPKGNGEG
ncbi:spore germination protein [Paenibacillus cisolokensis]|uniref:spore germination protein n=1 Tax=Paenibacillus cisolokensis TaxID=1658519 RepID=UPI003D2AA6FE